MLRVAFLALILASIFRIGFSQDLAIIPPTPNTAKITEFQSQKPNLYTGTASVNIPLHTINFDGWNLPLSLNYSGTGVRVTEEASEVGLGWSLYATGFITRHIRGKDDLFTGYAGKSQGYVFDDEEVSFDMGFDPWVEDFPNPESYYMHLTGAPDTEPDIFSYNVFGYSGDFLLSKVTPEGIIGIVKLTQDATVIEYDYLTNSFILITPEGFKCVFSVTEESTSFSTSGTDRDVLRREDQIEPLVFKNQSGRFRTISTWYLNDVTSPKGRTLSFNYDPGVYFSNSIIFGELVAANGSETCTQHVQQRKYLTSIESDEWDIQFQMERREDVRKNLLFTDGTAAITLPTPDDLKRYNGITIRNKLPESTFEKDIIFHQSYFNPQYHKIFQYDDKEPLWLRGKLYKLTIDDQVYRFQYYKDNSLPNKESTGTDHFGYYNGRDENPLLNPPILEETSPPCDEENPEGSLAYYYQHPYMTANFDYGIAGLLSKVIYPTKGFSEYFYEPHEYLPDDTQMFRENPGVKKAGGARIAEIKDYDPLSDNVITRKFIYDNGPTHSYGRLLTPLWNRYALFDHQAFYDDNYNLEYISTWCNYRYTRNQNITGYATAQGMILGYDKVIEKRVSSNGDSFSNAYFFENRPSKVLEHGLVAEGYPYLNGKVKSVINYDDSNNIVSVQLNQEYDATVGEPIKAISYGPLSYDMTTVGYWTHYEINRTFYEPKKQITATASPLSPLGADADGNVIVWGNAFKTTTVKTFDDHFQLASSEIQTSDGKTSSIKNTYAYNYPNNSDLAFMVSDLNLVAPKIEEVQRLDDEVVVAMGNRFVVNGTRAQLSSVHRYNRELGPFSPTTNGDFVEPIFENIAKYNVYDSDNGNLLEFESQDGIVQSFIWSYDDKYPVVHARGVGFENLNTVYDETLSLANYEEALRSHNLTKNGQITTYKFDPGKGVTEMTDPAGQTNKYEYDDFGRLNKVIDHDGNTMAQNEYHYAESQPTRILSLSGNMTFGEYVSSDFEPLADPDVIAADDLICKKDIVRILTISNLGEDDLQITNITLPTGFTYSGWTGIIPPEGHVDVQIVFDPSVEGSYSGTIFVDSDKTEGLNTYPISATYSPRVCDISFSTSFLDFDVVASTFNQLPITITNNGNGIEALQDILVNGVSMKSNPSNLDISVPGGNNTICINPGESITLQVNFIMTVDGSSEADLTFDFRNCGIMTNAVHVEGERRSPFSQILVDTSPINLGNIPYLNEYEDFQINVANTGFINLLRVTGVSFSDPNMAQHFEILTDLPLEIEAENDAFLDIRFRPTGFDQNISTDIGLDHDATYSNNIAIPFAGNRQGKRIISVSPSSVVFDRTGDQRTVTVKNDGNQFLTVDGYSPSSLTGISVTNFGISNGIAPGQSGTIQFTRTPGGLSPEVQTFTINSNKNEGSNTVTLSENVREISLSKHLIDFGIINNSSDPQNGEVTEPLVISNTGDQPFTVTGVQFSGSGNSAHFSIDETNFTLTKNQTKTVNITFEPQNFSAIDTYLTFLTDANRGNNVIRLKGQRTRYAQFEFQNSAGLEINEFEFNYVNISQNMRIKNTGNAPITISGLSYSGVDAAQWSVTPITTGSIAVNGTREITVRRNKSDVDPFTLSVLCDNCNMPSADRNILVKGNIRKLSFGTNEFGSFNDSSPSKTIEVSVTNSGNDALTVDNVAVQNNSKFTVSPTSFSLNPAQSTGLHITYTATDFQPNSAQITFSGNLTESPSLGVNAQWMKNEKVWYSHSVLNFTFSIRRIFLQIKNNGNTAVTVSSISIGDSNNFSISPSYSLPKTLIPGQTMSVDVSYDSNIITNTTLNIRFTNSDLDRNIDVNSDSY
ncbi:choice-of-anchor D domain-containing protein [Fulvivirga lutimaris]|uniref:choice-of-anchor D domain-containing protein n=1 Tax=Fulvivirga lutimaris TaxID=1819566 RepID=UPI0012BC30F9|nr:choice-of-anchor D domain-containing protein [Fulvivirga lutimaris]MTI38458.1 choice-of-anchor D domain-containing protein [Fulvivirga lutimaris]